VKTQASGNGISQPAYTQWSAKACWTIVVVACVGLWYADSARAEHANIDLKVISPDKEVSAVSDRTPPVGGLITRPVIVVKAGDPLYFQYFLTNTYPHGVLKKVIVRYYIVRIKKVGQKHVPNLPILPVPESSLSDEPSPLPNDSDLDRGVITQGQVTMNFKPHCKVGARMPFRIKQPGVYMVRVESLNTQSDHEHFSAIDLKVE